MNIMDLLLFSRNKDTRCVLQYCSENFFQFLKSYKKYHNLVREEPSGTALNPLSDQPLRICKECGSEVVSLSWCMILWYLPSVGSLIILSFSH
jgi:hypothetical protein